MTEKELLKLKRSEMLEIMLAQSREIDRLRKELEEAKAQVEDKEIRLRESGSIAEASLRLTNIFEEAQKAANIYLQNAMRMVDEKLQSQARGRETKGRTGGNE